MKFELNPDYVWVKKNDGISITSILPNQNEIFHFKGESALVLEDWLTTKNPVTDLSQISMDIAEEDWQSFMDFLIEKKILIHK